MALQGRSVETFTRFDLFMGARHRTVGGGRALAEIGIPISRNGRQQKVGRLVIGLVLARWEDSGSHACAFARGNGGEPCGNSQIPMWCPAGRMVNPSVMKRRV
jgi:hypothetical protein